MKKLFGLAAALMIAFSGSIYAIGSKAGTTTGEFLRLPAGAKPAAMGEAYAGLANDVYSLYFNVAGLARVEQQQALFAHTLYYMDVNHDYLAYARPFMKGGLGASITYLSTTFEKRTGDTDEADSNGSVGDMAVSVGYAQPLLYGINGGLAVKYISSSLDTESAASVAADIGLQKAVSDKINIGLAVSNLGGSLKYIDEAVAIGNTLDFGIGARDLFLKNLALGLDYKMLLNASDTSVNVGAEYVWNFSKDWGIAPRVGYISGNSTMTAGIGFAYKAYQLDYALNSQSDLGTNNRISLGMKF
jgi:hypothetical protein